MMLRKLLRSKSAAQENASNADGNGSQAAPDPRASKSAAAAERAFAQDVPEVAFVRARQEFFEAFGGPVVERARYFVLCVTLGLVIVALAFAISAMLPLKTVQPWVVKVDDTRGTVVLDKGAADHVPNYTPGRAVLERELFDFVHKLWAINADYPALTKQGHFEAYSRTRDRAVQEFKEFIERERVYARINAEPGLVRAVERRSVAFRSEQGIAHVRFVTTERSRSTLEPVKREWIMLVQFAQRDVTTPEEIEKNPLGLYITHFETNEER